MSIGILALVQEIVRCRRGSVAIQLGLMMIVVLGMVALGTEITFLMFKHRQMQSAADSAALGAATAIAKGYPVDFRIEADALAAEAGFVNGANGATITVNQPNPTAVEVIITQPQTLSMVNLVCSWYGSCPNIIAGLFNVSARAVAVTTATGSYCVLALNGTVSGAVTTQGTATVNLVGCSLAVASNSASSIRVSGGGTINADKVTTVGGIDLSGGGIINAADGIDQNSTTTFNDPYANYPVPAATGSCSKTDYKLPGGSSPATFTGGCTFSNGISLTGGSLTLNSGVYVINNGGLSVSGGSSLRGDDVTIVLTGNSTIQIAGGATINIVAPITGSTAGIAFFGRTSGTSKINGGANQTIVGAVYLPNQTVEYSGGSVTNPTQCMELIANTITFTGNSNFALDCTGRPIGNISGGNLVKLVE